MSEKVEILDKNGNSLEEKMYFFERFYNRNRGKIVSFSVATVLGVSGYFGYQVYLDYRNDVANKAYYNYVRGIETEKSLEIITEINPKLLSLIQFSNAMKSGNVEEIEKFKADKDQTISDLATYQVASLKKDIEVLNSYSYREGAVYKDLAIVSEAFLLIQNGKVDEAKTRLDFIEDTSALSKVKNILKHYGIVPEKTEIYDASTNSYEKIVINEDPENIQPKIDINLGSEIEE
jgi:hypothetical protein